MTTWPNTQAGKDAVIAKHRAVVKTERKRRPSGDSYVMETRFVCTAGHRHTQMLQAAMCEEGRAE